MKSRLEVTKRFAIGLIPWGGMLYLGKLVDEMQPRHPFMVQALFLVTVGIPLANIVRLMVLTKHGRSLFVDLGVMIYQLSRLGYYRLRLLYYQTNVGFQRWRWRRATSRPQRREKNVTPDPT